MTIDRKKRIEDLFQRAADLPTAQRSAFLDQQCAGDHVLHGEVLELLAHLDSASDTFLSHDRVKAVSDVSPHDGLQRIGQFRIVRRIGEGGMGTVFEAEQEHPRRRVALKVIRAGMVSPSLLRRFKHEADILGHLQHPGIAQIYEAGSAACNGIEQPYFAMEYVEGRALLEYATHYGLSVQQRLELFARICDAVQHAHQKGIIHRDLKPANILVVEEGSEARSHEATKELSRSGSALRGSVASSLGGSPKILDFGVARAIDSDVMVTMQTEAGQLIGTLSYMSPEQIAARPDELDTRSDVYALGVILFELLAGRLPYELKDRSIPEAGRIIRDQDPSRLSTANTRLRGDVETIVAKALEKDKSRRYQSAADLASDIRRYLSDEPIIARPASRVYQLRKFAKRNKALVGGVVAVFLVLVAGVVGVSLALFRAKSAEQLALRRLGDSQRENAKAEAVKQFLQKMLSSVAPEEALGHEVTVRDALDAAAQQVADGAFQNQPEVEAEVRHTIGTTYLALGLTTESEPHLRISLEIAERLYGEQNETTADYRAGWGVWLFEAGRSGEALPILRRVLELRLKLHSNPHTKTAFTLRQLASVSSRSGAFKDSQTYATQAIAMYEQLEETKDIGYADSLQALAHALYSQGDLQGAKAKYDQALPAYRIAVGERHPAIATALDSFALVLKDLGEFDRAEQILREVLELRRHLLGSEHPALAANINDVGIVLLENGRPYEAEPFLVEAVRMRRKLLGDHHFDVGVSLNNLGRCKHEQGAFGEAERVFREALSGIHVQFGEEHPIVAATLDNLAQTMRDQQRLVDAEETGRKALGIRRKILAAGHPAISTSCNTLGTILRDEGKLDEAEPLFREALEIRRKVLGADHVRVGQVAAELALLLEKKGDHGSTQETAREALAIYENKAPTYWMCANVRSILGGALATQRRLTEAEPLLLGAYAELKDKPMVPVRRQRELVERLVKFYEVSGDSAQATTWRTLLSEPVNPTD